MKYDMIMIIIQVCIKRSAQACWLLALPLMEADQIHNLYANCSKSVFLVSGK